MKIYVLDDEPIALRGSVKIIKEVRPEDEVQGFGNTKTVFRKIKESGEYPDVVFSDIEMPGMSGLDFAVKLKKICPEVILIFVTAYSQYALDAFRIHVHGYILKPLTADRVREELEYALQQNNKTSPEDVDRKDQSIKAEGVETGWKGEMVDQKGIVEGIDSDDLLGMDDRRNANKEEKLQIQCFGTFEVIWKGMPLMFNRGQTKELFAYLIDRKGAACTPEEIARTLWTGEDDLKILISNIRILVSDLKRIFGSIGKEDLLIIQGGRIAIRREGIDCDYYRMLAGEMDAVNAFHGEYMSQYNWAVINTGKFSWNCQYKYSI